MTNPAFPHADIWNLFDLTPVDGSDTRAYLQVTLERCAQWFQANGGSIFLGEPGAPFALKAAIGPQTALPPEATVVPGHGIAGIVAELGEPRIVHDPRLQNDLQGVTENTSIASSMVIPLLDTQKQAIGVLNISRQAAEQPFGNTDLEQATALAAHVALAVSNAQLVGHLHRTIQERGLANEKLLAVLDSVPGAIVVVDAEGEVVNHNQAAQSEAFLADIAPQITQPQNHPQSQNRNPDLTHLGLVLRETVETVLKNPTPKSQRAHDNRSDRTWLVQGTPLASGGAVVTVQEVTNHERQIRELARVKRLAEIGQMTAAIAHEIRNPLTGIRSAAQMIRQHPDLLPEFIGTIEEEALKLNALCDEFLEFARPLQLDLAYHPLPQIAQEVAHLLQPLFQQKNVTLQIQSPGNPRPVSLDQRRVGQVVHNLLRNALEAAPPGSTVQLEATENSLAVKDQGPGIPPEEAARLFSPFFTTKANGTGLGLCNSRKIIDAHQGELAFLNLPEGGACFVLTLPPPPQKQSPHNQRETTTPASRLKTRKTA